jgi:hypothetical protein
MSSFQILLLKIDRIRDKRIREIVHHVAGIKANCHLLQWDRRLSLVLGPQPERIVTHCRFEMTAGQWFVLTPLVCWLLARRRG